MILAEMAKKKHSVRFEQGAFSFAYWQPNRALCPYELSNGSASVLLVLHLSQVMDDKLAGGAS